MHTIFNTKNIYSFQKCSDLETTYHLRVSTILNNLREKHEKVYCGTSCNITIIYGQCVIQNATRTQKNNQRLRTDSQAPTYVQIRKLNTTVYFSFSRAFEKA
jgi:hypothetical protein